MEHDRCCDVVIGAKPSGTRLLAQKYANGEGVAQDYCTAAALYRQAMEEGDDMATCLLGECYFRGAGVKKDYAAALRYFQQSDTIRARSHIRRFFRDGSMCRQPDLTDFSGLGQAVERNVPGACVTMGHLFFLGKVGYRDLEEGVRWYSLAGDDPEARFCLGFAHATGAGAERDLRRAAACFRQAAKQDFPPAAYNLRLCCQNDANVEPLSQQEEELAQTFLQATRTRVLHGFYSPEQFWSDRGMEDLTRIIQQAVSEQSGTESEG